MMHVARIALFALAPLATIAFARAKVDTAQFRDVAVHVMAGYEPSSITANAGDDLRLHFRRDVEGCTNEVVFPAVGLKRELPLRETVTVDRGTVNAGEILFRCGMAMVHGKVIVKPEG